MIEQNIQAYFATKTKWLIRIETLGLALLGIAVILYPHGSEVVFNYAFATMCIIYGIAQLIYFANDNKTTPATNWVPFFTALAGISIGAVMYVDGMFFVKTFLATWLFAFGAFQIYRVIVQFKTLHMWILTLICGVASVFFSIVMRFDWPIDATSNVGMFIGPNLIVTAITIWYNNRQVFKTANQ
jgi:uncharacterized membrane protein HdeD (DUF308 family)